MKLMMGGVIRNGLAISSRLCKLLDKLELKPIAAFENLHLPQTKDAIRNATRGKAGIYLIINLNTGKFYIGSAITGHIFGRFHAHLIALQGNKLVRNTVIRSRLENFA